MSLGLLLGTEYNKETQMLTELRKLNKLQWFDNRYSLCSQAFESLAPSGCCCSGRLRKCGLVGGSMSLGVGFEASEPYTTPSFFSTSCLPFKSSLPGGGGGGGGSCP